jgi:hypothetical protein
MSDHDQADQLDIPEGTLAPHALQAIVELPAVAPVETDDGFLMNPDSGEIVGHSKDSPTTPFRIIDDSSAEFVLRLWHEVEGKITGLQARRDALVSQMDSIIRDESRRLAWLEYRFGPELRQYAKSQLKGKGKTKKFAWGSVSFRENKRSNVIVSEDEALAYVEAFAPQLVKQKRWVGVTEVLEAARIAESVLGEPQKDLGFMKHTGASETAKISTGIQLEGTKTK